MKVHRTRANPLCVKRTQCGRRGAVWSRCAPWTGLLEVRSLIILPLLIAIVLQATLLVSEVVASRSSSPRVSLQPLPEQPEAERSLT